MTLVAFLLGVIATWRLGTLFAYDKIFTRFRSWLGVVPYEKDGSPRMITLPDDARFYKLRIFLAEMLTCIRCNSVWFAAFMLALYYFTPSVFFPIALWLTFSQLVISLETYAR